MSADTETEISAETDTETDNFRSLVVTVLYILCLKLIHNDSNNFREVAFNSLLYQKRLTFND